MKQALAGVRVLDITQVMAGPFCSTHLADMGADVIKIEPPTGDSTRKMAGSTGTDSPAFNAVNRGKRGIVVNLKTPEGVAVVKRLALQADVLIENYRPGVMREFGLDYETLSKENPGLIYASVSGYGQTGPYWEKGGFDLIAQGMSGIMSVTGEPGRPPAKCGLPITDLGAGMFALTGILMALYYRTQTGEGQYVDASLIEAGVALSVWESAEYFSGKGIPQPLGSAHRMSAPYQAIRCADGYVTLGAANDRLFQRFAKLMDREDWLQDPSFSTDGARVKNRAALVEQIEAVTMTQPRSHWIEKLEANEIPCGPILNYEEVFADPHVQARQMVVETEHPTLGRIKTLGSPLKLSKTPPLVGRPAPMLGQHTDEVLRQAGWSDEEIAALRAAGAVK